MNTLPNYVAPPRPDMKVYFNDHYMRSQVHSVIGNKIRTMTADKLLNVPMYFDNNNAFMPH
jgi:hypothetical protein